MPLLLKLRGEPGLEIARLRRPGQPGRAVLAACPDGCRRRARAA